jgi:hypothetical protein
MARRTLAPTRPTITGLMPSDDVAGRTDVTIADFIVEQVNAGVDPVTAAQSAGVSPPEFLSWMREGALTLAKLNAGAIWETDFTPDEQDALWLAVIVNRAHAQHIARLTVVAEQMARGGIETVTTRTRSVAGQPTEEWRTVERTLPDPTMLRWKLEKLEPAIYGPKATLNVTVVDLTDTDVAADVQVERMLEVARALNNQTFIDTTATDNDG